MNPNPQSHVGHDDVIVLRACLKAAHPFLQEYLALKEEDFQRDPCSEEKRDRLVENYLFADAVVAQDVSVRDLSPETLFVKSAPLLLDLEEAVHAVKDKDEARKWVFYLGVAFEQAGYTAVHPQTGAPMLPDLFHPPQRKRQRGLKIGKGTA